MVKSKGLGRGLDALLANESRGGEDGGLEMLSVGLLRPGKYQPRTRMDQESLGQLADSIRTQGLLQPILARSLPDGSYEIIAGERRWRAAQLAGLSAVPVTVRDIPDEATIAVSLIENIQRENLNPLEEATGIHRLIEEFRMTHESAAAAIGRSRSAVTNLLRLLNLAPEVREMLLRNRIEMGHARALLALSQVRQIDAAREVAHKALSVRQTERLVTRMQTPTPTRPRRADPDILRLQEDLSDHLGAKVTITAAKKGSGRLVISYRSLNQLDGIISQLKGGASLKPPA